MKQLVSKVRAKKTKHRQKKAGKTGNPTPLRENPIIGFLIALVLWISVVLIVKAEHILERPINPSLLLSISGDAVLLLVGLLTAAIFLEIARPHILRSNTNVALLALISLISVIPAKVLLYISTTTDTIPPEIAQFLIPFAIAPLLATILTGSLAGISVGAWTSLVVAVFAGQSFSVFATGMIATIVAARSARQVRTRSKVFRIGLIIGVTEIVVIFTLTAISQGARADPMIILQQAGACLISSVFAAIVVLLILPVFEAMFRITTNIALLELSDLGHPILQRLAIEAPGTYHHSLVVANLAQAAADEIGANSLLARVASYFHDIGKLTKPDFFVENIHLQSNPHDDLPPSMSTLVITAHVKEGLSLAMLHKLPDPIMRIIREHHGTSLLSYFHHKARTQLEFELSKQDGAPQNGATKIDEGAFRYPGPKPSSRESAIICLADAVEAASRSMEKTTPSHIEAMINDITNMRFEDGQLGNTELTLAELTRIKRSFVFTLTNMLHGRVPYPKDENRDKQQAKSAAAEQGASKKADTAPPGQATQAESG